MKKILSILLAGAVALGLMGCSGDLHDAEALDMTKLFLRGNMNAWGATELVKSDTEENTWTVKFAAAAAETQFAIATNDDSWTTAFRKKEAGAADGDPCVAFTEAEFGKETSLYHGGGMGNATIATEIGTEYIVKVVPDSGFVKVTITKGEAPKTAFLSVNGEMIKADLVEKGSYKYVIEKAPSTELAFMLNYDGKIYGASTDTVAIDTDTELIENGAKVIKITTEKDEPYNILINTKGEKPVVKVEYNSYKAFIVGDISGAFARMSVPYKGKSIAKFTFTYEAAKCNAWGGSNGTINFKIKSVDNWNSDADTLFADTKTEADTDPVSSGEGTGSGGNAVVEGLEEGVPYTIVLDASDPDDVQLFVVSGSELVYVAGEMNSWTFGRALPGDADGQYFKFTEDATYEFKAKDAPSWDYGSEIFFGATVTSAETPCGASDNASVTAKANDKLYFYKNASGVWCAKLVPAN